MFQSKYHKIIGVKDGNGAETGTGAHVMSTYLLQDLSHQHGMRGIIDQTVDLKVLPEITVAPLCRKMAGALLVPVPTVPGEGLVQIARKSCCALVGGMFSLDGYENFNVSFQ